MRSSSQIPFFTVLLYALGVYGSVGPVANLHISNKDIAPDGFSRPAVVVEGTAPGPLITGRKVRNILSLYQKKRDITTL